MAPIASTDSYPELVDMFLSIEARQYADKMGGVLIQIVPNRRYQMERIGPRFLNTFPPDKMLCHPYRMAEPPFRIWGNLYFVGKFLVLLSSD